MRISSPRAGLPVIASLTILLTACGGGDDSGAATAPPTAGTPPSQSVTPPKGTESPVTPPPSQGPIAETPDDTDPPASPSTPGNTVPTIAGTPPPNALPDTAYVFVPTAEDADGDILHFSAENVPEWASFDTKTGRLEGTPTAAHVGSTWGDIRITVTDGADDASLEAFSISVTSMAAGAVELTWSAPTTNEDGSPLTDLSGYKIYYGTAPGEYTQSVSIDNPGIVTYVLENLVPATYYFVATAVNGEGSESDPSEVTAVKIG